jgi:hypothetical protein
MRWPPKWRCSIGDETRPLDDHDPLVSSKVETHIFEVLTQSTRKGLRTGALGAARGAYDDVKHFHDHLAEATRTQIATPQGVALLRSRAEMIEELSRTFASDGSHTKMAKDQAGHDPSDPMQALKTVKFDLALELAREADRLVLGGMSRVLDAPSTALADFRLQEIYTLLDNLIGPPTEAHPLWHVISPHIESAKDALQNLPQHDK